MERRGERDGRRFAEGAKTGAGSAPDLFLPRGGEPARGLPPSQRTAFWIRFERMQRVQTLIRRAAPLTRTRILWRFGSQRRAVMLLAWLT